MMDTEKILFLVILFLIKGMGLFLLYIIWSYLKSKTPAMETLMDEMIKELIMALILFTITIDFEYIVLEPVSKELSDVITFLKLGIRQYFLMQLLIVTIIRYLIIFHGPMIDLIIDRCGVFQCMREFRSYKNKGYNGPKRKKLSLQFSKFLVNSQ